jgi:gluconokinase
MSSTVRPAPAWGDAVAPRIVVMGVSGCGKSTVGRALAQRLQVNFVEGDALHPERNVAKMAAGTPLTDADRHGWLQAVAEQLSNATAEANGVVASCSALKRRYRDLLRTGAPDLRFVFLHGDPALLAQRVATRAGHYMPASLLQSQLDTLEPPQPDEAAIALDIDQPADRLVAAALQALNVTP